MEAFKKKNGKALFMCLSPFSLGIMAVLSFLSFFALFLFFYLSNALYLYLFHWSTCSSSAFEAVIDVTDLVFCMLLFLYITKSATNDYYIVVLLFITMIT